MPVSRARMSLTFSRGQHCAGAAVGPQFVVWRQRVTEHRPRSIGMTGLWLAVNSETPLHLFALLPFLFVTTWAIE